jgi:hypothetical protein
VTQTRAKPRAVETLVKRGMAPRILELDLAAAYVGLSAAAFLNAVRDGRYPAALPDGKRRHWDRKALDAAVDRRSGLTANSGPSAGEDDEIMRAINAAHS